MEEKVNSEGGLYISISRLLAPLPDAGGAIGRNSIPQGQLIIQ